MIFFFISSKYIIKKQRPISFFSKNTIAFPFSELIGSWKLQFIKSSKLVYARSLFGINLFKAGYTNIAHVRNNYNKVVNSLSMFWVDQSFFSMYQSFTSFFNGALKKKYTWFSHLIDKILNIDENVFFSSLQESLECFYKTKIPIMNGFFFIKRTRTNCFFSFGLSKQHLNIGSQLLDLGATHIPLDRYKSVNKYVENINRSLSARSTSYFLKTAGSLGFKKKEKRTFAVIQSLKDHISIKYNLFLTLHTVDFFFLYLKGSFKYFKTIFYTFKRIFNEQSVSLTKEINQVETNFSILKKQYISDQSETTELTSISSDTDVNSDDSWWHYKQNINWALKCCSTFLARLNEKIPADTFLVGCLKTLEIFNVSNKQILDYLKFPYVLISTTKIFFDKFTIKKQLLKNTIINTKLIKSEEFIPFYDRTIVDSLKKNIFKYISKHLSEKEWSNVTDNNKTLFKYLFEYFRGYSINIAKINSTKLNLASRVNLLKHIYIPQLIISENVGLQTQISNLKLQSSLIATFYKHRQSSNWFSIAKLKTNFVRSLLIKKGFSTTYSTSTKTVLPYNFNRFIQLHTRKVVNYINSNFSIILKYIYLHLHKFQLFIFDIKKYILNDSIFFSEVYSKLIFNQVSSINSCSHSNSYLFTSCMLNNLIKTDIQLFNTTDNTFFYTKFKLYILNNSIASSLSFQEVKPYMLDSVQNNTFNYLSIDLDVSTTDASKNQFNNSNLRQIHSIFSNNDAFPTTLLKTTQNKQQKNMNLKTKNNITNFKNKRFDESIKDKRINIDTNSNHTSARNIDESKKVSSFFNIPIPKHLSNSTVTKTEATNHNSIHSISLLKKSHSNTKSTLLTNINSATKGEDTMYKKIISYIKLNNSTIPENRQYQIYDAINKLFSFVITSSNFKHDNRFSSQSFSDLQNNSGLILNDDYFSKIALKLNNEVEKSYLKNQFDININSDDYSINFLDSIEFQKVFNTSWDTHYHWIPFHEPIEQLNLVMSIFESLNIDKKSALAYLRFQKSKDDLLKSLKIMPRSFFVIDYTSYPFNGCRRTRHYSR